MRKLVLAAPAIVLALALPAVAGAGTVTVDANGVAFSDGAGQDNRVDVDTGATVGCPAAWCVEIEDDAGAPASSDPRCFMNGLDTLTCGFPARLPVVIDLGGGTDLLASLIDPGDTLTGRGGPGNDELYGTSGPTTLDGGDGDDALYPDDNPYSMSSVTPGTDTVHGGSGTDTVWYIDHDAGVRVSLDGVANDGGPSDVDNVQPDVENIVGSRSADVLSGSDAANVFDAREGGDQLLGGGGDDQLSGESDHDVIDGGPGADTLTGGSGDDRLTGGPGLDSFNGDSPDLLYSGNDTLDAADAVAEPVACGPGADLATVDADDRVANEAQNVCETVRRAGPAATPFAALGRPSRRGSSVRVRLTCRRTDPTGCNGRLALRSARKVRVRGRRQVLVLGRAAFSLDPGAQRTVRVRLSRTARSLVRRRGRLAALAVATSTRPAGLRAQRRFTLRR